MAFRSTFRQHNVLPVATGIVAATAVFYPRPAHAEAPQINGQQLTGKKPIYDDLDISSELAASSTNNAVGPSPTLPPTAAKSPTPTDRLTVHVRSARLKLYELSTRAEAELNSQMDRALSLENSFTSTIASLAPPPTANEQVLPGAIYVLVAAMAGSILSRNRGFILRASTPLLFGIGAGYAVLPITMQNIGDLIWTYEEKYPVVRDTHLQARKRIQRIWETGKAHTAMTLQMGEDKVNEAKDKLEDWVKKGK